MRVKYQYALAWLSWTCGQRISLSLSLSGSDASKIKAFSQQNEETFLIGTFLFLICFFFISFGRWSPI